MSAKGTIGGKIVLEGEQEYRAALKNITQEQKELRSEMKLCSSEFDENQNSIDALTKKHDVLGRQVETQQKKVQLYAEQLDKAQKAEEKSGEKVSKLKTELENAEKELSQMASSTDVSTEALEEQQKAVDDLKNKLSVAQQGYEKAEQSTSKYQTSLNYANADLQSMQKELDNTEKYLDEAQKSTDGCATSIDQFGKRTKEAGNESKELGTKTTSAVDDMAGALAAAGIAATLNEIKDSLLECVDAAEQFETATAKLSTIADTEVKSMSQLKNEVIAVSTQVGVAGSTISDVAYNAISAGVDTANAVNVAMDASKLAIAGFTNTESALSVLTTAMNSYKISAEDITQISDSLVQTQNLGVLTIDKLSSSMGKAISTASAYSVDLYNLEAGYISLTKAGISVEESTTYISGMFAELGDSGSTVAGIITEKTGKSFGELMKSGMSLGDVMGILYDSVEGNSEALMNLWSSQEAGKASNAIINQGLETFNQNLDAVRNSTGATEKAFETMADTSEQMSNRMNVAVENLKIAIGEELQPTMNGLYNTGTDLAEWATEVVRNNPALVQGVTALTVGMGTLTVGITAVKVATLAWNVALNMNPIALTVTAVAALTAAVATLALSESEYTSQINEQIKAREENLKELQEEINSRRESAKETEITITTTKKLADAVMDLNAKEVLNKQEKIQLKSLVDQLNSAIPDLNLTINEQNGLLTINNNEFEKLIENQQNYLMLQAAQEDQAEIAKQLYEAQKQLNQAMEEQQELQDTLVEKQEAINNALENSNEVTYNTYDTLRYEIKQTENALEDYDEKIAETQGTIDGLNEEYEAATGYVEQYSQSIEEMATETANTEEVLVGFGPHVATVSNEVAASMETLKTSYNEAYLSALESLSGQVGLFDELNAKSDLTAKQMAENLQSQTSTYSQYSQDLKAASELLEEDTTGSFSGVLQSIMDMGVEGAGYLHELVEAAESSTGEFDDVMSAFTEMQDAKDTLAKTMADIETGYSDGMMELITSTEESMTSMADAINAGVPDVTSATNLLCTNMLQTTNQVLGIENGKSATYKSVGKSISEGIAEGISEGEGQIQSAVQNAVNNSIQNASLAGITARINQMLGDQLQ